MRRGKIVLERIENKMNRQVTFSKRKGGLMKKTKELSVLCDADVALILFSSTGKLFEYSNTDIKEIIERYYQQRCSSGKSNTNPDENEMEEVLKLRTECDSLEHSISIYLGNELQSLSLEELDNLEKQSEKTLSKTRQLKSDMKFQKIADLRQREQDLGDQNAQLMSQLEGGQQCMQLNDDDQEDLDIINWYLDTQLESDEEEADDGSRE